MSASSPLLRVLRLTRRQLPSPPTFSTLGRLAAASSTSQSLEAGAALLLGPTVRLMINFQVPEVAAAPSGPRFSMTAKPRGVCSSAEPALVAAAATQRAWAPLTSAAQRAQARAAAQRRSSQRAAPALCLQSRAAAAARAANARADRVAYHRVVRAAWAAGLMEISAAVAVHPLHQARPAGATCATRRRH